MNAELDFDLPDGRHWRYRFDWPQRVLRADQPDEVAGCLLAARQAADAGAWVIGFVAYEAAAAFDAGLTVKQGAVGPLALFAVFSEAQPLSGGALPGPFDIGQWHSDTSRVGFDHGLTRIREDIRNGVYYQANYTRRLQADFAGDALGLFRALHNSQPGRFSLYLDWKDGQVASVSPELFFHWQPAIRQLITRPMKGTAARGRHPDDDARVAAELAADPKERAENVMIVDLLRNDLGRIAESGSVHVSDLFRVEALPSVWQMTSTISARARPQVHLEDVFAALFPCGSVTGAPKGTSMRAIAEYEDGFRGIYCGALGVIAPGGEAVFNVPIRTVQIDRTRQRALCGIGSGITWSSQSDGEWAEWQAKRRFLWRATAGFEVLETLRLTDGQYELLGAHLARMADAVRYFGFPWRTAHVEQVLEQCARRHSQGHWRVRLRVDRQGSVQAEAFALTGPTGKDLPDQALDLTPTLVQLATEAFVEDTDFVRHKTTWRVGYERFAPSDPAIFDTLLINPAGELTEFIRGNLALQIDGQWWTPPARGDLLPGVRRSELLRGGVLQERVLVPADLALASHVLFINSLRGCVPVRVI